MLVSPSMLCEVKSWIPDAIASTLSLNSDERAPQPVIAWLTNIRASIEEYDPLITVRPYSPHSEDEDTATPNSAFDEILSQLGKEIYDLDLYKRNFSRKKEDQDVSLSILNIFDECMQGMTETEMLVNGNGKQSCDNGIEVTSRLEDSADKCVQSVEVNSEIIEVNEALQRNSENDESIGENVSEGQVNGGVNGHAEYSDCESTLSDVSYVASTPVPCERRILNVMLDKSDKRTPPPIPPRRRLLKTPSSASSTCNNIDTTEITISEVAKRLGSDSDSESTCWSYKECSTDGEIDPKDLYAAVWSHSSGFHNSDEILRKVLSQNHATISRISFDTVSDISPAQYTVYALPEVGTGAHGQDSVVTMSPDKPTDDGYERVKDAITTDENIYEEIEYGYSYTDEGCSCEGSVGVEMESCSISASSECVDRESPVYVNLRDNEVYAVTADVIFWKNLLSDPYYNDDEEDEWITPEECAVYSREQRPPLVIPRITQYRPAHRNVPISYEESPPEAVKSSVRQYDRLQDWSPGSERGFKSGSDSPPFVRLNKRYGGSTENLLSSSNARRPTHLQLPASSSGDSLDVEVRERPSGQVRSRKSRSMLAPKQRIRSPVPAPRMLIHQPPSVVVLMEGPVKRTKFSENGKKSRKNWVDCYMTLTPTSLIFYKDQKTYYATKQPRPPGTPPSPTAPRAELVLPLQNAHIMQCIQMHTRRHTRSLVLRVGYDEYLLQHDNEEGAKRWLMCIQNVYYKLGPPKLDEFPLVQYQSSNTDLESLGRTPPVSRHSNRSNQKAGGSSNEDLSDSTEVSIPKSHVKRRLRNFFAKRPTMDSLVKKGIYQEEPVFGRQLEEVCPSTSPRVPDFVVACIREIESCEENMTTDGLYRASGNLSQVQKIRLEVDQNNLSVIENSTDIHVLTGSLKLFFRELKQPLIPCSLFDRILAACSIKPREAKIKEFRDIIQSLPPCNRDTLKYLLEHLLRVTQYSEQNRMHTANLAIVFGPTLLWAPAEQAHNIAIDCIQQNHVVEILLNDFKEIFAEENGKSKKKT